MIKFIDSNIRLPDNGTKIMYAEVCECRCAFHIGIFEIKENGDPNIITIIGKIDLYPPLKNPSTGRIRQFFWQKIELEEFE